MDPKKTQTASYKSEAFMHLFPRESKKKREKYVSIKKRREKYVEVTTCYVGDYN